MSKTKTSATISRRNVIKTGAATAAVSTFFINGLAKADDPEFTLKLATAAPKGTPWHRHLKKYNKRVAEATNGRVKIKAYWGSALGDEASTAAATAKGTRIQAYGGTAGGLAKLVPELQGLEAPFLFPSLKAADKALDANYGLISDLLASRGFKLLFYSENGRRSIGLNKFVKSPGDLKGIKVRSQPTYIHIETWKALGASPVPLAVTEVRSNLQTGLVKGFANTPLYTFAGSWYQDISHFTLTKHSYQPGLVIVSKKVWDSMPSDVQKAMLGEPEKEAAYGRKKVRAIEPQLVANFTNAGIQVHKPSSGEIGSLKKATSGVIGKYEKKFGSKGKKLISAIKGAM